MPQQRGNSFDGEESRGAVALPEGTSGLASFSDRLQERQGDLPVAMRKVVALIEQEPQLFTDGSITSLAARAGVAPSTVTRLSKALGYPSVARMRMAFARELAVRQPADPWMHDIGSDLSPDDDPRALVEKLTFAHLRMIRNTAVQLDVERLNEIAERIAAADRVDVYAIGGSANAAQMFADRAFRVGIQVRVWSEVHAGLVSASFLGPGSVAIAVSRSGRTPEVAQMLREARRTGALTAAFVGNPSSRVAAAADVTITTMSAEQPDSGDLMPRYAQGFALDVLFLLLARVDVETTRRRLALTSRSVERHRREWELAEETEPPV